MEELQFIDVGGIKTQIRRGGKGEPLIYLHSGGGETFWMPFHEALASRFEVIAPAHPGFDQSQGLDRIEDIEDVAFHYLDLLDALGIEKAKIVGLSLGGWIAAELAVRWPQRLEKLVLVDSAGIWLPEHPIAELFGLEPAEWRELVFYDPKSELAEALIMDNPPDELFELILKGMEVLARLGWNPYLHNPKLHARLKRIKCPTLVVWGKHDKLIPLAYGEAFRDAIPEAKLCVIEECGHLPIFEKTEVFVEQVANFLSSNSV